MRTILCLAILLLCQLASSQPTKLETTILKSPSQCIKKVERSSHVQLQYVSRLYGSDNVYEDVTVEITPGNMDNFAEGFLEGIQGMCTGETRQLIVPAHLHTAKAGTTSETDNKAVVYEVQVLDVKKPLFTSTFWAGIAFIALAYIFVSKKASTVDVKKQATYKKKMEEKSL